MAHRVLVIDDDEIVIEFAKKILEPAGYEVLSACDGRAGLDLASEEKPDLVLLDLMMPRMHGYDACEQMRANHDLDATKIVVTSGKGYATDKRAVVRMGADGYLQKPYNKKQLLAIASHLLGIEKPAE
jgi:DNA-binding response OmpR family regulator